MRGVLNTDPWIVEKGFGFRESRTRFAPHGNPVLGLLSYSLLRMGSASAVPTALLERGFANANLGSDLLKVAAPPAISISLTLRCFLVVLARWRGPNQGKEGKRSDVEDSVVFHKISTKEESMEFLAPCPQEILNGEIGLTSLQIAMSTGIQLKHINEKIRRPEFQRLCKTNGYDLVAVATKSGKRGRPGQTFILSRRASKALVATLDIEVGNRYLDFLFDCEEKVERAQLELMPLLEKITSMQSELDELRKQKYLPGPRSDMIPVSVSEITLWGTEEIVRYELRKKDELSELSLLKSKIRHMHKMQKGLALKVDELAGRLDCEEVKKNNKIIGIVKE